MPFSPLVLLLETTEHLIGAHRSAKLTGDRTAIELIETALKYVGGQLSAESSQGGRNDVLAILGEKSRRRCDGAG